MSETTHQVAYSWSDNKTWVFPITKQKLPKGFKCQFLGNYRECCDLVAKLKGTGMRKMNEYSKR